MTFYQAAIEVLTKTGRSLHYKKITETAIKNSLLTHIGKTPEITMGARLRQEAKKKDSQLVQVRPGVFALASWKPAVEAEPPALPPKTPKARQTAAPQPKPVPEKPAQQRPQKSQPQRPQKPKVEPRASFNQQEKEKPQPKKSPQVPQRKQAEPKQTRPVPAANINNRLLPFNFESPLAEYIYYFLAEKRNQKEISLAELVNYVFPKNNPDRPESPEEAIRFALISEDQHRTQRGEIPIFIYQPNDIIGLHEWNYPDELFKAIQDLLKATTHLNTICEQTLKTSVETLSRTDREHLIYRLLLAQGYHDVQVSKRLEDATVLVAKERRFSCQGRIAFLLKHGDNPIDIHDIVKLRGSLHHYSAVSATVLTFKGATKEAIAEAEVENLPPVRLVVERELIGYLRQNRVGVKLSKIHFNLPNVGEVVHNSIPQEN